MENAISLPIKRNRVLYWVFTLWLSLGMASTGIVQLLRMKSEVDLMSGLGYPIYFLSILGVWKILGVVAILIPKYPLLKEWAYAGFFFAMSGAVFSHIVSDHSIGEILRPLSLLVLTLLSWYFRPLYRRPILANQ